ncbi:hypothetical protein BKA82DRAFT_9346 [Pisolithus tinctorius]|uniref:Uncharacterized protein n=1 Tax=Pisolithus tinctorius Marx 270 TaxID=870435 RepID=A0A0C3P926_PISTI|nr:hypothetical protein BKA82DRAFT_9346 [Pisolithus tinctorius]KIO04019.1 hypothetical protein M404DRAFT_9346 [Pisolithus tinctorius Marx 270]
MSLESASSSAVCGGYWVIAINALRKYQTAGARPTAAFLISARPLSGLVLCDSYPLYSTLSTRATENAQISSPGGSRETSQAGGIGPNSQSRMQPVLTDEQADFVASIYQNNVPAPVVARVLERMLANPNPSPYGSNPGAAVGPYDPELRAYMPMPA